MKIAVRSDELLVKHAEEFDLFEVLDFFNRYLQRDHDAVPNAEYFCPDGVRAAVRRRQVMIALVNHRIIAACRFYKRKTKESISLYQFAVDPKYRGHGVLKEMLSLLSLPIEVDCPVESAFNSYYVKTGWVLLERKKTCNRWGFGTIDNRLKG